MKPLAVTLLLIISTMHTIAGEARFYIGTYTNHTDSKGIYTATIDTDTGRLSPLILATEATSPNFLTLAPGGKYLYAATETGGGAAAAFRVGPEGALTLLNESPAGEGTCHIWSDRTGGNILVASYGGKSSIACFHAQPDGSLGERTAFIPFTGSGPDPKRQKEAHAHSTYTSSDNCFVYVCDLGTDNVFVFKLNAAEGTLTPNDPPSAKVPPGGGPRHLAFHPAGGFVYVCNEMGMSVTAFKLDPASGTLTPLQTLPTVPADFSGRASVAEIFCHPGGKWLYVSNRVHDSIAVFAIAPDGKLTWLQDMPAQVQIPRGFAIDPTGQWLIVAGQKDNRIAVLKIDPATGKLSATDQTAAVGAPVCIIFEAGK